MIKIAVVEQTQAGRDALKRIVLEFGRENGLNIEIQTFKSGTDVIEHIYQGFSIVFLDHEISGLSGIDTARAIRSRDKKAIIIFISSLTEQWEDGYEVQAFYYLIKPLDSLKTKSVLAGAFQRIFEENRSILIITENGLLILELSEIICFKKVNDTYTDIVHRSFGMVVADKIKSAISDIEIQFFPHGFIRPHHAYLVNPLHIKRVFGKNHLKYIETSFGEEILISQHNPSQLHFICEH